jgi:hypothetical protein
LIYIPPCDVASVLHRGPYATAEIASVRAGDHPAAARMVGFHHHRDTHDLVVAAGGPTTEVGRRNVDPSFTGCAVLGLRAMQDDPV